MPLLRLFGALSVALAALWSNPSAAQSPADSTLSDARVVELVGAVAIDRYSNLAARAALDTTTNPMAIRPPDDHWRVISDKTALWSEWFSDCWGDSDW